MATPANWEQFQEDMGRWQAAAEDLARRYEQLIDVAASGELGALAYSNDLNSAPIGSLSGFRNRIGVQNVAGRAVVGPYDELMARGAYGIGESENYSPNGVNVDNGSSPNGLYRFDTRRQATDTAFPYSPFIAGMFQTRTNSVAIQQIFIRSQQIWFRDTGTTSSLIELITTANSTRDSNGNLRAASPIFRVATNAESAAGEGFEPAGSGMHNDQAPGVTCERVETGVYVVSGSLGFDSNDSWPCGFTIPTDANGNAMLFAESEQSDDGTITIRTFEPLKDDQGWNVGGDAMDVPDGRFIALRLKMPAPPSDEYPDEEPAPELTPEEQEQERLAQLERWRANASVDPRQARLALSRRGLLKAVDDAISSIKDEHEREEAGIEWEYATLIRRADRWVNTLYSALGLSQEDVDELFLEAAQI